MLVLESMSLVSEGGRWVRVGLGRNLFVDVGSCDDCEPHDERNMIRGGEASTGGKALCCVELIFLYGGEQTKLMMPLHAH